MRDVYVAGVGMTRFAKQPASTLKELTAAAVTAALAEAELAPPELDAVYFGNAAAGAITRQEMVKGQVFLRPLGFEGVPVVNVENACASASSAFHLAWLAVASGQSELALAIGAEKMTHADKRVTFEAIGRSTDVELAPVVPDGRSPLMDAYAEAARAYMETSGATAADCAAVVVKNQSNGALNPLAQYGRSLSIEDVLGAREIAPPLTLYMCSPISDGAAAAVLSARRGAVRVGASVVRSGLTPLHAPKKGAWLAAQAAYESAGLGPDDLDVAEVHDAAAPAELQLYEQIGLAPSAR